MKQTKRTFTGVIAIVMVLMLASCSQYTCPTYAKHPGVKYKKNIQKTV